MDHNSAPNPNEEKEKQIMKEMMPFLIYAVIPLLLTFIIAKVFGPSLYNL